MTSETTVPNDSVIKNFNYKDTLAVGRVAKQMMIDEGFNDLDPLSDTWAVKEEADWKAYCGKMGIHNATPFPDLANLPIEIRGRFEKAAMEVESRPEQPAKERPNFDHLMVDPIPVSKDGSLVPIDDNNIKKTNNPGDVNWSILPGSMAQFDEGVKFGRSKSKHEQAPHGAGSLIRQAKLDPTIHVRDENGKPVQPTKEQIEKFSHPDFDASRPSHTSQTDAKIVEAEEREEMEQSKTANKGKGDPTLVVR